MNLNGTPNKLTANLAVLATIDKIPYNITVKLVEINI